MKRNSRLARFLALGMTAALLAQPTAVRAANTKEETVYVKTDASGNPEEVIVSDWLKNVDGLSSLRDTSDLTDIENVKGEETWSQSGSSIVWDADGSDIYYQGTTTKELPVSLQVTYYLDGKETAPEELAGQSGHVKICYTYENLSQVDEVYTPFTMVTGLVLSSEHFENVEVEEGKLISDGENYVVFSIGFPGLAESLRLEEVEGLEDIEIPDSFTVEADATDFRLTLAMTVATPLDLDEMGIEDFDSLDDLKDSLEELSDAAEELVDGTGELADGVQTLKDACRELLDGMNSIDENMGTLAKGAQALADGSKELAEGIQTLADGIQTLEDGKGELLDGIDALASGSSTLKSGAKALKKGTSQLEKSCGLLLDGAGELAMGEGSEQLAAGVDALVSGSGELAEGAKTLSEGVDTLLNGSGSAALLAGAAALEEGSSELSEGIAAYTAGAETVAAGTETYIDSVETYVTAVNSVLSMVLAGQASGSTAQTSEEVVLTISQEDYQNMQSVLTALEEVQSAVNSAGNDTAKLLALYQSYDQYVAKLNDCVSKMSSAVDGVEEKTVTTVEQSSGVSGSQAILGIYASQLAQAGASLTAEGNESVSQLQAGARTLTASDGSGTLGDSLENGAADLASGAETLNDGIGQVFTAVKEDLKPGVDALAAGASSLSAGIQSLDEGLDQLLTGAGTLAENMETFSAAMGTVAEGSSSLYDGMVDLTVGIRSLKSGAGELAGGISQLAKGSGELSNGGGELADGAEELADGSRKLKDGTAQLVDGGEEFFDGVSELLDGSEELRGALSETQ